MALTIVENDAVTGGVDTHADAHVAAALDRVGGLLGTESFPTTPAGYVRLLGLLQSFGTVGLVGVEGTDSYGTGLTRYLSVAGITVVEVNHSDRQDRARAGKSDPLDAVSAARAALSGKARGAPRGRDGTVEAIRALMVAKRSARGERTRSVNQARSLVVTGPDDLRARFERHSTDALAAELAALRPPARATSSATAPASPCESWDAERSSWPPRSTTSTACSYRWWNTKPPTCLPCTAPDRTSPPS